MTDTELRAGDAFAFLPRAARQVDDVLQDLEFADSCEFHYVVDPFDLLTFCFPLYQAWKEKVSRVVMVDREIALYEVFYNHPNPPIFLDEYKYELTSTVRTIDMALKTWVQRANDLTFEKLAPSAAAGVANQVNLEHDFSVILAAAMGLFQASIHRLRDVFSSRLTRDDDQSAAGDRLVLRRLFATHRGTAMIPELADAFYRRLVEGSSYGNRGKVRPFWREHIRRSCFVDTYAADRLFSINEAAENEFQQGNLERRHIIFFLSSAQRSEVLFDLLNEERGQLAINGMKICLLRTPSQIYLRLIEGEQDPSESRTNLEMIKKIVKIRTEKIQQEGVVSFDRLMTYKQKIASHYEKAKNFLLLARLAEDDGYDRLLEKAEGGKDVEMARQILRDFVADPRWPERARVIGSESMIFAGAKIWFTKSLLRGLANLEPDNVHSVRSGSDSVASAAQHLPSVFRVEMSGKYAEMLEEIRLYFRTPIQGRPGRGKIIRRAAERFLDLDSSTEELAEEHELLRCLLFFALPTPEADSFAFDHAQEMLKKLESRIVEEKDLLRRNRLILYGKEFRCVVCWAARRKSFHKDAEKWSKESIEKYVEDPDPRFYHSRCLNIFSWFSGYKHGDGWSRKPSKELTIALAIDEGRRAIELYRQWGDEVKDQIAALYNTIACLCVYRLDDFYDVSKARMNLNLLKDTLDRTSWYDRHPEYFHTEALVEYHEAEAMSVEGKSLEERLIKLNFAKEAIGFAYDLYEGNKTAPLKHRDLIKLLRDDILSALKQLEVEIVARQRIEPPIVHIP